MLISIDGLNAVERTDIIDCLHKEFKYEIDKEPLHQWECFQPMEFARWSFQVPISGSQIVPEMNDAPRRSLDTAMDGRISYIFPYFIRVWADRAMRKHHITEACPLILERSPVISLYRCNQCL